VAEGPTLYRLTRDALGDIFGQPLIEALDAAETQALAAAPRRLPRAVPERVGATRGVGRAGCRKLACERSAFDRSDKRDEEC